MKIAQDVELKVLGHRYRVVCTPKVQREHGTAGSCTPSTLTIEVDPGAPRTMAEEALLHEICEALKFHLQLEIPHDKLTALSEGLYQVLADNGVKLPWLTDASDAGAT